MNIPEPPLSPDVLDELLSADLDGEFDRAAIDLGFEPPAARAAVAATPDAGDRRAELVRARELLATPLPLDPERSAAFVAAALEATADPVTPISLAERRSTRVWRAVAGIAAAAAVVVGIVAVANTTTKSGSDMKSSSAGLGAVAGDAATGARTPRTSLEFGDVSASGALEARVRAALPPTVSAPELAPQATSPTAQSSSGVKDASGYAVDSANKRLAARKGVQGCTTVVRRAARLGAPVLSGRGTSGAVPVYVVVFREGSGRVAYVMSTADCSVITRVPVP